MINNNNRPRWDDTAKKLRLKYFATKSMFIPQRENDHTGSGLEIVKEYLLDVLPWKWSEEYLGYEPAIVPYGFCYDGYHGELWFRSDADLTLFAIRFAEMLAD